MTATTITDIPVTIAEFITEAEDTIEAAITAIITIISVVEVAPVVAAAVFIPHQLVAFMLRQPMWAGAAAEDIPAEAMAVAATEVEAVIIDAARVLFLDQVFFV